MTDPLTPQGLVGDQSAVPPGGAVPISAPINAPMPAVEPPTGGVALPKVVKGYETYNSSVADNADYVGEVNVTDTTTDILRNPSGFIDDKGGNLSDRVPDIDPDTEGTNLAGSDYALDADGLNVATATGSIDTAASVVRPNEASTYDAATATGQVNDALATAATTDTNEKAIVDAEGIVVDTQGMATGINEDGSINTTGAALNKFAHQNISNIIDTSTVAGKMLAQNLGEGNYTDSKATVKGQLEILTAEFTDSVTGEPKIPTWAAGIARNVSRSIAFKGITGTAATGALAQAMIEATLPIAKADSEFYQTLTVKNLDNKQQMIINKANVLSKMEMANLDVRTSLAVNNAKTFMTYDMANLENEQQTEIINTQSKVQAILEDSNQTNIARRFGAEQTNDMDKFYDNLGSSIDMYNTGQKNQMSMFNTGEKNEMGKFNANLENSREQFYLDMQYQVDAANASWRQTVTLTENEMAFNAAATDVKNILDLSSEVMNQLWDRTDSLLDFAWKEGENSKDREMQLEMAKMQIEAARISADGAAEGGMWAGIGSAIGTIGGAIIMSDERLKQNVKELGLLPNGIMQYSWDWTDEAIEKGLAQGPSIGVVAQQVQSVRPENVRRTSEGYLQVDYRGIEQ